MLSVILGEMVDRADASEDQLFIEFSNGYNISIYNSYNLSGLSDIKYICGKILNNTIEDEGLITLEFSGGIFLKIDMSDSAYSGPEAMCLRGPEGNYFIWN